MNSRIPLHFLLVSPIYICLHILKILIQNCLLYEHRVDFHYGDVLLLMRSSNSALLVFDHPGAGICLVVLLAIYDFVALSKFTSVLMVATTFLKHSWFWSDFGRSLNLTQTESSWFVQGVIDSDNVWLFVSFILWPIFNLFYPVPFLVQ